MNVKKGDLAILIKSASDENIGKICEVLEYLGKHKWPDVELDSLWRVKFREPIMVYVEGPDGKMRVTSQTVACAPDSWLMPIRPDLDEDETDITAPTDSEVLTD